MRPFFCLSLKALWLIVVWYLVNWISDTGLVIGTLFSGLEILEDECVIDEKAPENAFPIIRIPGHFNDGIKLAHSTETDTLIGISSI